MYKHYQPLSGNRLSMDPLGASSPEMLVERFNVVELANGTQTFEPIIVYVSAFVERLFDVNVDRYTHDTSIRLMMSWNDTTFEQLVANATGRSLQPLGLECQRYCSQLSLECCDEVFLPSVQLANVDELTEGRVHTENFIELTDDTGNKTGAIIWISDIHGVYHSNFNFDKVRSLSARRTKDAEGYSILRNDGRYGHDSLPRRLTGARAHA